MSRKCGIGSRTGCLTSAVITIITRIFGILFFVLIAWKDKAGLYDEECKRNDGFYDTVLRRGYCYFLLVSSLICIIVSLIMIFGVKREKRVHLLPWITWILFELICYLSAILAFSISFFKNAISELYMSEVFPFVIGYLIIDIYLMVYVLSYYNSFEVKPIIPYYKYGNEPNILRY
ncbi:uncharacterized protein LOC111637124 [Centruroides sculpturatus]|uniref:uncharacterized protein LOC111616817 n=1 Tax=Centruroides sculpturatus TaxID=218467 RepID=UPI000C6E6E12|nr:uncharacterized protein LOC111616817 [Centruroides sculpturatus]XP_023238309.1 uncharacterized protein LOC111637124 [Centruroides sculpturatus]